MGLSVTIADFFGTFLDESTTRAIFHGIVTNLPTQPYPGCHKGWEGFYIHGSTSLSPVSVIDRLQLSLP
jgi:hypothetical protein